MRAGDLDRRVTIQQRTLATNEYGEAVETWSPVATVWAQVQPLRGQERFAAQQHDARVDTRFRLRWRTGIGPATHRLQHGDDVYEITAVLEIGRREGLEILATAHVE